MDHLNPSISTLPFSPSTSCTSLAEFILQINPRRCSHLRYRAETNSYDIKQVEPPEYSCAMPKAWIPHLKRTYNKLHSYTGYSSTGCTGQWSQYAVQLKNQGLSFGSITAHQLFYSGLECIRQQNCSALSFPPTSDAVIGPSAKNPVLCKAPPGRR